MKSPAVTTKSCEIRSKSGEIILADLRYADRHSGPVIIICHSFMAFKDWGFFPHLAEGIAAAGFPTLAFNYTHGGTDRKSPRISDFRKFEQNTFTRELEDLTRVIGAKVNHEDEVSDIADQRIVLLGHSRGGGTAILQAASDPRVVALVTLSAVSTFDRWTEHQKSEWRRIGHLRMGKDESSSPLRLGLGLLDDLTRNERRLNILRAAEALHIPWLLVHGEIDLTVPVREAEELYHRANKASTEFVRIEKAGHLYNGASFEEDHYRTVDYVIDLITHWLQKLT